MRLPRYPFLLLVVSALGTGTLILSVAWYIARFGVNLPYWDQWEFVSYLATVTRGEWTWSLLLTQHNEHRPVFPRLLWQALASVTPYNVTAELWLNLGLALATFVVLLLCVRRLWQSCGIDPLTRIAAIPLIAFCVFNLVQWESWLLGFQTIMFLGVFCVVVGFLMLGQPLNWRRWGAGALLGIVAIYSTGNALLYGPIGLCLVIVFAPRLARVAMTGLWAALFLAASGFYLCGWHSNSLGSVGAIFQNLFHIARWFPFFLGSLLLNNQWSQYFGAVGIGLLLLLVYRAYTQHRLQALAPYLAIISWLVVSGLVIAIGRASTGIYSGLAPRYITMTAWFWVCLIVRVSVLVSSLRLQTLAALCLVPMLGISTLQGSVAGYNYRYLLLEPIYETIHSGQMPDTPTLSELYGIDPAELRARIQILCTYGWSACAPE